MNTPEADLVWFRVSAVGAGTSDYFSSGLGYAGKVIDSAA